MRWVIPTLAMRRQSAGMGGSEVATVVTRAVTRLAATVTPANEGGTVTAIAIDRARASRDVTDPRADLRDAHDEVAAIVAELNLDDTRLWPEVEGIVIEITAAAYAMTSQVTGTPADAPASRVPPIVRVRELATAQRRLFAALDGWPAIDQQSVEQASRRIRSLGELLRCVALSVVTIDGDPGGG
jgi:hypothetical protein